MPFHFTCPYCFKKTLVHEALAGKSGPCASCGKSITVPEPPPQQPAAMQPINSGYVAADRASPRRSSPRRRLLAGLVKIVGLTAGLLLLSGLCLYLLWPSFQGLKSRRDRIASLNNLQRIARALNDYALTHGVYPPPVVYDASGLPLYSWRVLILPQLGEDFLAASFHKDLAWDAPENVPLLTNCPSVFVSPAARQARSGAESNYALITGNNTIFPLAAPMGLDDVTDGREQTLLVVETSFANGEWTKPWDIDITKLNTKIGSTGPNSIGGLQAGGAAVVFADETPGWLPEDLSPALLRGLISPAAGERLDPAPYHVR